jgi:hypothetical protein
MPSCPHCNRNTFEIPAVAISGTKYNCVQYSAARRLLVLSNVRVEESDEAFETRVTEALRVVVSSLQTINSLGFVL